MGSLQVFMSKFPNATQSKQYLNRTKSLMSKWYMKRASMTSTVMACSKHLQDCPRVSDDVSKQVLLSVSPIRMLTTRRLRASERMAKAGLAILGAHEHYQDAYRLELLRLWTRIRLRQQWLKALRQSRKRGKDDASKDCPKPGTSEDRAG